MSAQPARVIPIEEAPSRRRPVVIEVGQAEIVARFNEIDTLVSDAYEENAIAVWVALYHVPDARVRRTLLKALNFNAEALRLAIESTRLAAGIYDWKPPKAD